MMVAGAAGSSGCSEKMITDTKNSVGISCRTRLPRKVSIFALPCSGRRSDQRACSLQADPDHPHDAVGNLLVAGQAVGVRDQDAPVIEIDDVVFLEHLARDLLVERLALLEFAGEARLIERRVDVLVAKAADIEGRLAFVKAVNVAVGVDAAGPADLKRLITAGLGLVERCR